MKLDSLSLSELSNYRFNCPCGKTHCSDIHSIVLKKGAIDSIPETLSHHKKNKILLVSDVITHAVCGRKISEILIKAGFLLKEWVFSSSALVPNEKAVGDLITASDMDTSLILAVGSGTINDLCRFAASRMKISYAVSATAPSMDGYASTVSPLILNGFKTTLEAISPTAIIADLDILKTSPLKMIRAGFGDIVGKWSALSDWKLAEKQTSEYYCEETVHLMRRALDKTIAAADQIFSRSDEAITSLTEALVLSGVAMSFSGNSRPASGAEHHLAHFWEMRALAEEREHPLHGESVGVGTVVIARVHQLLGKDHPIPGLMPEPDEVEAILKKAGCFYHPAEIGVSKDIFHESILHAMEVRSRYTILQYVSEKGLLKRVAKILTDLYYNNR